MNRDEIIADLHRLKWKLETFLPENRAANEAQRLPKLGPAARAIGQELRELLKTYEDITMEEPTHILENGTRIVTASVVTPSAPGAIVREKYLQARRANAPGVIRNWVAGHGGDLYWVEHEEETDPEKKIAVYGWHEFDLAPVPEKPVPSRFDREDPV